MSKKNFYATWKMASKAAIKLGIKTCEEYREKYFGDKMLPCHPKVFYKDFPCWRCFLGNQKKHRSGVKGNFYKHWKKACQVAMELGIETGSDYRLKYHDDIRLPSDMYGKYPKFPGFPISDALGSRKEFRRKKRAVKKANKKAA